MKDSKIKSIKQKIIISILTVMLMFTFVMPTYSQADIGGVLLTPLCELLVSIGDVINNLIGKTVGTGDSLVDASVRSWITGGRPETIQELNAENTSTDLVDKKIIHFGVLDQLWSDVKGIANSIFGGGSNDAKPEAYTAGVGALGIYPDIIIPRIKVSPAEIFAGKVAFLDADFFSDTTTAEYEQSMIGGSKLSTAGKLKKTISNWYQGLRLIAIVGLLSVLVYVGIRILTSAVATDKAKYKQMFVDWIIALCLIFFLHYIMVFTMTMVKEIQKLFVTDYDNTKTINTIMVEVVDDSGNTIVMDGVPVKYPTNLAGYNRALTECPDAWAKLAFTVMYLGLTCYTCYFFFIYIKRLIILTVLTIIAPLVALTYPIDKIKDSRAQAFEYWLREYIVNAMLPVIHLILYTVLISSALDLVTNSPLYAICIFAFIVPAEKMIKSMFGIRSETAPAMGGFAGGAIAAQALQRLAKSGTKKESSSSQKIRTTEKNVTDSTIVEGDGLDALASDENSLPEGSRQTATYETTQGGNGNQTPPQGQNTTQNQQPAAQNTSGNPSRESSSQRTSTTSTTSSTSRQQIKKTTGGRAGLKDIWNNRSAIKKNLGKALRKKYNLPKGKEGRTLLKRAAQGAGKAYLRGSAMVGGAMIGLAAGTVSGNMNDMWKGATLGGVAGNAIGNKAEGNVASVIQETREVLYGSEEAQNRKADEEFIDNVENREHVEEQILKDNPELGERGNRAERNRELEKRMQEYAEYRRTGVTDIKEMDRLHRIRESYIPKVDTSNMTSEQQRESERQQAQIREHARAKTLEIAKLSTHYDAGTFRDAGKNEKATKALAQRFRDKGLDKANASAVANDTMKKIRKIKGE
mgnify:CR=1 FL=1